MNKDTSDRDLANVKMRQNAQKKQQQTIKQRSLLPQVVNSKNIIGDGRPDSGSNLSGSSA
jgi:hypothetical protein